METYLVHDPTPYLAEVYSEVEPFEGWKREGFLCFLALSLEVYSEVEPFEGWKLLIQATLLR